MLIPSTQVIGATPCVVRLYDNILAGSSATLDATSLSGAYSHLRCYFQGRSSDPATSVQLNLTFNGDSGANYDYLRLIGTNAAAAGAASFAQTSIFLGYMCGAGAPSGSAGIGVFDIPNYAGTTFHKQLKGGVGVRYDTSTAETEDNFGNWRSTAAISQITLTPAAGSFIAGSRLSIYGIL